jgi:outer membrane protein assembly factor BamB
MNSGATRPAIASALGALFGAVSIAVCSAQQSPVDRSDDVQPRGFAIPDTRLARALRDRAAEQIAAKRWPEAIAALQDLLVSHRGEVLRIDSDENNSDSGQTQHRGVGDWAREQLLALPADARASYRDRYAGEAAAALERARLACDRHELVEVARRYPLCDAARDAWWTLGDIELETGNHDAALQAWQRAADLAHTLGTELTPAARARLEYGSGGDSPGEPDAAAHTRATLPGADCASWRRRIDSPGPMPIDPRLGDQFALLPCVAGDTLLVSDSMRLFAFDAWTGATRWTSDEAPGWDTVDARKYVLDGSKPIERRDFFSAIQRRALMIQPAAAAGVAVAALQIPVTHIRNTDFQGQFKMTTIMPDRRLFAFDLATGAPLWNHMPPVLWDGESGTVSERLRVAAPPVIVGSRIVVPVYRMQGRVDMHVACFDLFTGRTLWSTALISGQLELNMFGRPEKEFCAAPVCIAGDRVIVLTQLGAVAALDLYGGDILWETLYDQIGVPAAQRWRGTPDRRQIWNNTAPVVAGNVVVATPIDSEDMLGLDLESGALAWSSGRFTRYASGEARVTLLGADETTVWIAGAKIVSARAPRGLAERGGPSEISESGDVSEGANVVPRPALTARNVIVAGQTRRVALDRFALKREDRLASAPWEPDQSAGHVVVADGALFFTTPKFVTACIDWPIVEKRYRERSEANPADITAALEYARILERRGEALLDDRHLGPARELLARARATLEARGTGVARDARGELDAELHAVLYLEARASIAAADAPAALESLRRALQLAPTERSACRTLVTIAELQLAQGARDDWFATLTQLDARCHNLPMPDEWWSAGGAQRFAVSTTDANRGRPIAVGLWVEIVLAQEYARRGDTPREFEQLHRILAEWNDPILPPPPDYSGPGPGLTASATIQARLDTGANEAYAPFEKRAHDMLVKAQAEHDNAALERLARWYPHSMAAREATDARMAAALEARDARTVAALALGRVPDDWSPARARPAEIQGLLTLGAAFDDLGNHELARELLRTLAAEHGEIVSGLARHRGATLEALARALPAPAAKSTLPEHSSFGATPKSTLYVQGTFAYAGNARFKDDDGSAGDGAEHELALFVRREPRADMLVAFDGSKGRDPRWTGEIERGVVDEGLGAACTADTVLVAGRGQVHALDARTGEPRWNWSAPSGERVERLHGTRGVALLVLRAPDGRARLLALDAFGGIELWARPIGREYWPLAVLGSGRVVLLPSDYAQSPARVLDLFSGARELEIPVSEHVGELDAGGAWIEGRLLIVPLFPKTSASGEARDVVLAWDMNTGRRAWHVLGDEQREFDSIARRGDDTYLLFPGGVGPARTGFVLELDTKLGATRRVQNALLGTDDVLVGVQRHHVVELGGPFLMVRSTAPGGDETLLRAIHLPYGERWVHRLGVAPVQLYNYGPMPLPELSSSTLALVYTAAQRGKPANQGMTSTLLCFDRESGLLRGQKGLDPRLGAADAMQLTSLGGTLWIVGHEGMLVMQEQ